MSPLDRTWVVKKDPRTRSKDEMTSHWVEAASPDPTPADVSATDRSTNRVWLSRPRRARHFPLSLSTLLITLYTAVYLLCVVLYIFFDPQQPWSTKISIYEVIWKECSLFNFLRRVASSFFSLNISTPFCQWKGVSKNKLSSKNK